MITLSMIEAGYKSPLKCVQLIDSPNGDGVACKIGDYWFYFGGMDAEQSTAKDYPNEVPEDEIIKEIFEVLDDMRKYEETDTEYSYYEAYLNEHGITSEPRTAVPDRRTILFHGQTRRKGEKVRMNGEPLPGNWVYGGVMQGNGDRSIIYGAISGKDENLTVCAIDKYTVWADTVGEYSGCDDFDHTHIFEHDFIEDTASRHKFSVVFVKGAFRAVNDDICEPILLADIAWRCKVIGNKFDDPDLLMSER